MPRSDFNLAQAIGGIVSELNTGAPEVKMIPIWDIIPNPANFYKVDMEALKPLMDSIAMDGLHHYPLVMKHPEEDGKWLLIDGERRYTACKALVEEGNEDFKEIPCTVKEYGSPALAELQLILSNSTNRVLSGAELELAVFTDIAIVGIGVVYIAFRSLGKITGAAISARAAGCQDTIVEFVFRTLRENKPFSVSGIEGVGLGLPPVIQEKIFAGNFERRVGNPKPLSQSGLYAYAEYLMPRLSKEDQKRAEAML